MFGNVGAVIASVQEVAAAATGNGDHAPSDQWTLEEWLGWQRTLIPNRMAVGLERVRMVWSRLGPTHLDCPVITVGGTNGKSA